MGPVPAAEKLNVVTRLQRWNGRLVEGNLGWGAELWGPVDDDPAFVALAPMYSTEMADPDRATMMVTHHLLWDVVNAAGAVEYTSGRIRELTNAVQTWADENVALDPGEAWPTHGHVVITSESKYLTFELGNLAAWVRAFRDRIQRDAPTGSGTRKKLGLLPAMNRDHPATREVREVFERFCSGTVPQEANLLAALILHASSVPSATGSTEVERGGRILAKVPDRLQRKVWSATELTYRDGRDAVGLSSRMLKEVESVTDAILDVFEKHARRSNPNPWRP